MSTKVMAPYYRKDDLREAKSRIDSLGPRGRFGESMDLVGDVLRTLSDFLQLTAPAPALREKVVAKTSGIVEKAKAAEDAIAKVRHEFSELLGLIESEVEFEEPPKREVAPKVLAGLPGAANGTVESGGAT